ncbi:MAG TPA: MASE4 domain-containing protein [Bradyrhizobium sp.]|nr:MASE4 domain-containing protein [Bradyrhizobium sp.]
MEPSSPFERRLAFGLALVSFLAFLAVIPFARVKLTPVLAFIPSYEAALAINELVTATLLFGQQVRLRSPALLVLACGYLFSVAMIVPHALTFPGVFGPHGVLGGGDQTTAWLYMFWHGGFPLFVIGYALLRHRDDLARPDAAAAGVVLAAVSAVLVIAAALTLLATWGNDLLPMLISSGSDYSLSISKGIGPTTCLLCVVAVAMLWRRRPSVLDLWLTLVMFASALDVALSAVVGSSRYDLGFYAGRLYGLLAASFVLIVLLVETYRLYGRLAHALATAGERTRELIESREQLAHAQRLEAVGKLTGGVAHDFNNLLTVIIGNLDMIARNIADADLARLAATAIRAANRGARLTQQLLMFSRREVLRPETVNPNRLLIEMEDLMKRAVGPGVAFELTLDPALDPAHIDAAQFQAAILNIVVNARDALPDGGRLQIRTRNLDAREVAATGQLAPGFYIAISIADDGVGIPPDVLGRVFEPFFTTKDVGKGSGLGLSQVYGFAKESGGLGQIKSEPGLGTTVEIILPRSERRPISTIAEGEPGSSVPLRRAANDEVVLVVDDDSDVLEIAVRTLRQLGYRTLTAQDAREALNRLRMTDRIDILFSDVIMPGGMNGAQLALEARRLRPDLKVLLTSGYTADALSGELGLGGVPAEIPFLKKPYRNEDLAARIGEVSGSS